MQGSFSEEKRHILPDSRRMTVTTPCLNVHQVKQEDCKLTLFSSGLQEQNRHQFQFNGSLLRVSAGSNFQDLYIVCEWSFDKIQSQDLQHIGGHSMPQPWEGLQGALCEDAEAARQMCTLVLTDGDGTTKPKTCTMHGLPQQYDTMYPTD